MVTCDCGKCSVGCNCPCCIKQTTGYAEITGIQVNGQLIDIKPIKL